MDDTKPAPPRESPQQELAPIAVGGLGCLTGPVAYFVGMVLTMGFAPRNTATMRPHVMMSWEIYACLPTGIALALVMLTSVYFIPRQQTHWRVGCMIAVAVCIAMSVELLRRDFIGKF